MNNPWSDSDFSSLLQQYPDNPTLTLRTYVSRLLGREPALTLQGGGNTSVKTPFTNRLGQTRQALYVKASGANLATLEPRDHTPLDLAAILPLLDLPELTDPEMAEELQLHRLRADAAPPSIEALLHAALPAIWVDHTHAEAILALVNRKGDAPALVRDILGPDVLVLPYATPGIALARAAARAIRQSPNARAMVLVHHGLVTWGDTARASWDTTLDLVQRAEAFLARTPVIESAPPPQGDYPQLAPRLRGKLALATHDPDRPHRPLVLLPLLDPEIAALLATPEGQALAATPPITGDHLIRVKPQPLLVPHPDALDQALEAYRQSYLAACQRQGIASPHDPHPRILLLPGLGAVAAGLDLTQASLARDIAQQGFRVKRALAASGGILESLGEKELLAMEYHPLQQAKLRPPLPGAGRIALVTGAAGAIGSGLCRRLLEEGFLVAAADLPGPGLDSLPPRPDLLSMAMDVTDPEQVARGFDRICQTWGGLDLIVINAGAAHVATLADLDPDTFRRLSRVNTEGALHLLAAGARHFRKQGIGGDMALVSTKNVFAPGASFGAYSATKAAAHQLARIASLELADIDVRVNMIAPDAVFSDGDRRSGLWAEVGPSRMRARGLDEKGLEAYYQQRNLLKARVTADHVAEALLFFAHRKTPTTGATLPVDGGLPDATPR